MTDGARKKVKAPGVVSAFLVPGSPLALLRPDNPPWRPLVEGFARAAHALAAASPDVVIAYSTQWIAVLDELWQTRSRLQGVHVDENWYEYGDLPFDIAVDVKLAQACVEGSRKIGVSAKAVDYDGFPIDTGTIVMATLLNRPGIPMVIAANNLYHDGATTERLAAMAVEEAAAQGKRVALVGVGGLSGSFFRQGIEIAQDRIADPGDDRWNRQLLEVLVRGNVGGLREMLPRYIQEAKAEMGMKHLSWLLGGLAGNFSGAELYGYAPAYGCGAAVVGLRP